MFGEDIKLKQVIIKDEYLEKINHFDSGNESIDKYLREEALSDTKATTKLFINKENEDIIGMYSLACSIMCYEIDGKTYPMPSVEIKHFAIDKKYQDMSFSNEEDDGVFSDSILNKIINEIRTLTENDIGADKITLFSVPDAVDFYKRNLFDTIDYKELDVLRYLQGCTPMCFDLEGY